VDAFAARRARFPCLIPIAGRWPRAVGKTASRHPQFCWIIKAFRRPTDTAHGNEAGRCLLPIGSLYQADAVAPDARLRPICALARWSRARSAVAEITAPRTEGLDVVG